MLFNSLSFLLFFPVVFFLYWLVCRRSLKAQNVLLLVASYFFYACWDWRFLFLLAFSTALDYFTGLMMAASDRHARRKFWLILSIVINLGFLGLFKYYNFFAESFADLIRQLGLEAHPATINVILPVGISFYTFHGLSYVIDVYKQRITAERNIIDYSVFVSFFPLLVAGPIERATHLLPQIRSSRTFDYSRAVDGLRQILWGFFKKIVIADQCAIYVNEIFDPATSQDGSTLALGAVLFAFQIYGDFSGYSDIALGTARLLGIDLLRNFSYPYFSRDIAEFWRRWHISLSTWFRDYVYIPLGGSKGSQWQRIRNVMIIFVLSGFWHGANWTFIFWGFLNALFFLPSILRGTNRNHLDIVAQGRVWPSGRELTAMCTTFLLTTLAWVFFRAYDISHAFTMVAQIFSPSFFTAPSYLPIVLFGCILMMILVEWMGRERPFAIQRLSFYPTIALRWGFYILLINMILLFQGENQEFIYFQF